MFVSSSGQLASGLYLLTLGHTCRYAIGSKDRYMITDPGLSLHVPHLLKRLEALKLPLENLTGVLVTHPDPDRIGGMVNLLQALPTQPHIYMASEAIDAIKDQSYLEALLEEENRIASMYDPQSPAVDISNFKKFI